MKRAMTITLMSGLIGLALTALAVGLLGGRALADDPITNLSLEDAQVPVGGVVKVELVADTLPAGLSGFIIAATTTEAGISIPVLFESPAYGLATVHQLLDGSFRLSVADLLHLVEAGAVDVTLGTISYSGVTVGTTTAALAVTSIQDGDGITEDIDGNGIFGFTDIVALFEMLSPPPQ